MLISGFLVADRLKLSSMSDIYVPELWITLIRFYLYCSEPFHQILRRLRVDCWTHYSLALSVLRLYIMCWGIHKIARNPNYTSHYLCFTHYFVFLESLLFSSLLFSSLFFAMHRWWHHVPRRWVCTSSAMTLWWLQTLSRKWVTLWWYAENPPLWYLEIIHQLGNVYLSINHESINQ